MLTLLDFPRVLNASTRIVGGDVSAVFVNRYIRPEEGGKYVRTKAAYLDLASTLFKNIHVSIHHDLIRIPYTHIIMECIA